MRSVKKMISLLLALAMVLAMAAPAWADTTTYTITIINSTADYTYAAYQIFAGDLKVDDKTLSNIVWGSGVTNEGQEKLLRFGKEAEAYANAAELAAALNELNATAFAKEVAKYLSEEPTGTSTGPSNDTYTIEGLAPGYYLIKNTSVPSYGSNPSAYTNYILQVVGDVTVRPKSAMPTVEKQVWDEIDNAETDATDHWGKTADHEIGERFQFRLIATIPNDPVIDTYGSYVLEFYDTMSAGITYEIGSASVSVKGATAEQPQDITGCDILYTGVNSKDMYLTITLPDLRKQITGSLQGAKVVVTYNAYLNQWAKIATNDNQKNGNKNTVYLKYPNNPNDSRSTARTVEDTVYVFTYKLDNTKVIGGTSDPLQDAGFKLKNATNKWYKVDESTKMVSWVDEKDDGTEVISDASGKFTFSGLDAGTYTMVETTTPSGYNTCQDILVSISATHQEINGGASTTITIDNEEGKVGVIVENHLGTTLPSTGGAGTTLFYIIGGALAVGALVLLVTKRRMDNEED